MVTACPYCEARIDLAGFRVHLSTCPDAPPPAPTLDDILAGLGSAFRSKDRR